MSLMTISEPRFSLNRCFDAAIEAGRLFGLPMRGHWLTVGTPEAIGEAEAAMAAYLDGSAS
jgi:MurNAc alpha-1-phosphate uridylyltransferase